MPSKSTRNKTRNKNKKTKKRNQNTKLFFGVNLNSYSILCHVHQINMSLLTHHSILQAQSDRSDALHRLAVGEDSQYVHSLLAKVEKRIATLQVQLVTEKKGKAEEKKKQTTKLLDDDITCCDCTNIFTFTGEEQAFYKKKGFKAPKRCKDCRAQKK